WPRLLRRSSACCSWRFWSGTSRSFGRRARRAGEGWRSLRSAARGNRLWGARSGPSPRASYEKLPWSLAVAGARRPARPAPRRLPASRNLIVLAITLLAYAAQFVYGVLLIIKPHDSDQLINLSFIVFVTLIVSLQRAWSLLKGKHLATAPGSAVPGDHDPPHGP